MEENSLFIILKMEQNVVINILERMKRKKNINLKGEISTHDMNVEIMVSLIRLSSG